MSFETYGKIRQYSAAVSKERYFSQHMKQVIGNFFNGSTSKFASFFAESNTLNLTELEQMKAMLEDKIETLKAKDE